MAIVSGISYICVLRFSQWSDWLLHMAYNVAALGSNYPFTECHIP